MRVWPGRPSALGATWDGIGVNFALFSKNATEVELCLFDSGKRAVRLTIVSEFGLVRAVLRWRKMTTPTSRSIASHCRLLTSCRRAPVL
jgi:pullulanase/glycogen debranching enzyme